MVQNVSNYISVYVLLHAHPSLAPFSLSLNLSEGPATCQCLCVKD